MHSDDQTVSLKLIPGGRELAGPVSRLGLRNRFAPSMNTTTWIVFLLAKAILIAAVAYYVWG